MTRRDLEPLTVEVPLQEDPPGVFRVGKSRVLSELFLRAFRAGATPEAIVQSYPTLSLSDVYAIGSRYVASPAPFDDYLRHSDELAKETRHQIEQFQGLQANLRAVLMARSSATETEPAQQSHSSAWLPAEPPRR